jgi:hypothetical protein
MHEILLSSLFAPVVVYSNSEAEKGRIIKENRGKSGVYR